MVENVVSPRWALICRAHICTRHTMTLARKAKIRISAVSLILMHRTFRSYKLQPARGGSFINPTSLTMTKFSILAFLKEQRAPPVPLVTADLSGKIIMVTGSNTGLGFEAAKHFASMNPERLILACRNETKGQKAAEGEPSTTLPQKGLKLSVTNRYQDSHRLRKCRAPSCRLRQVRVCQ